MLEVGAVLPEARAEGGALELGEYASLRDGVVGLSFQQGRDAALEDVDAIAKDQQQPVRPTLNV